MDLRKHISIFLLLVLSVQLLPVRQTISWLLRNQVTEELAADAKNAAKNSRIADEDHKLLPSVLFHVGTVAPAQKSPAQIDYGMLVPARHADDIPTPPPNC